jgi:flavorubredoxin
MPLELQIIRAREFVRLGAEGHFDVRSTHAMLKTLADACRKRGVDRTLLDVRDSNSNLLPSDLAGLVNAFEEVGFSPRFRLAILHMTGQEFRAKLFAFLSGLRGWKVEAFENVEEALEWLSSEEPAELADSDEAVPIKIKPTLKDRIPISDSDQSSLENS